MLAPLLDGLLSSRRSVRSFSLTPVPRAAIEDILRVAAHAPSNPNTQPWKVDILSGDAREGLTAAIMEEHHRDNSMPSAHFSSPLPSEYRERQIAFGGLMYGAYCIGKEDRGAAAVQLPTNYNFYGPPVGMIVTIDRSLLRRSWLDCGISSCKV